MKEKNKSPPSAVGQHLALSNSNPPLLSVSCLSASLSLSLSLSVCSCTFYPPSNTKQETQQSQPKQGGGGGYDLTGRRA